MRPNPKRLPFTRSVKGERGVNPSRERKRPDPSEPQAQARGPPEPRAAATRPIRAATVRERSFSTRNLECGGALGGLNRKREPEGLGHGHERR